MIFRAIFWVGLVALLMPHQPDIGLGRPGLARSEGGNERENERENIAACDANTEVCGSGLAMLDRFQDAAVKGLAGVRADIEAYRKTHKDKLVQE